MDGTGDVEPMHTFATTQSAAGPDVLLQQQNHACIIPKAYQKHMHAYHDAPEPKIRGPQQGSVSSTSVEAADGGNVGVAVNL